MNTEQQDIAAALASAQRGLARAEHDLTEDWTQVEEWMPGFIANMQANRQGYIDVVAQLSSRLASISF